MEQDLIWQGEVNIMKLFFPKRTLKIYPDKLVLEPKTPTQKYLIAIAGVLAGWVTLFVIGFVMAAILIATEG